MANDYSYIDRNLAGIRAGINDACRAAGRDPDAVTVMGAIKSADPGEINYAHRVLGIHTVGENRVQQLLSRYELLDREGLSLQFIGTLQTNKVKYIIDKVDMIQSLDSGGLAREIQKQAGKYGVVMDVLIEINSGSEESKSGVQPQDAEAFARWVTDPANGLDRIRLRGFMTMAPKGDEAQYRRIFRETRSLCDRIWTEALGRTDRMIMSMGMSESYAWAAAEGATMVRVGRGLYASGRPDAAPDGGAAANTQSL